MRQAKAILPFHQNTAQAQALPGVEVRTPAARRERKRAEARAVAEARAELGTDAAEGLLPQAVFHFGREDQIQALVAAREDAPDIGFMARLLALCSLPRTNPGNRDKYKRRNGPYTLYMTATGSAKLPYGTLPRLLLAWVCSEAVRTQSRELVLGASLSAFMRTLGIYNNSGGTRGMVTRLRHQMDRLFQASVVLRYETAGQSVSVGSLVADRTAFWWDERRPDNPVLWNSTIRLGEEFFNEIIRNPVPLDLHTLTALKRSSLGLDLYLWLVYRTFALKAPLRLSWPMLYRQFGADPSKVCDAATVHAFRTDCLRELKKIRIAWPELTYRLPRGRLVLYPTPPRITPVAADSAG